MTDCLQPHGLQHARLPCPSPTPLRDAQTHAHQVSDANQPSHPLSSPCPPAFNLSQHQGLFQWISSSHQVAKVLDFSTASVLPMIIQDWFPLGLTSWISLQSKGFSRVFSNTTVQKHQFFGAHLSLWSNSHSYTTTGKTIALTIWTFVDKVSTLHLGTHSLGNLPTWLWALTDAVLAPS